MKTEGIPARLIGSLITSSLSSDGDITSTARSVPIAWSNDSAASGNTRSLREPSRYSITAVDVIELVTSHPKCLRSVSRWGLQECNLPDGSHKALNGSLFVTGRGGGASPSHQVIQRAGIDFVEALWPWAFKHITTMTKQWKPAELHARLALYSLLRPLDLNLSPLIKSAWGYGITLYVMFVSQAPYR